MRLLVVSVLLVFGSPFVMTDVVDSFSTCRQFFFKEQPPMIQDILENSVSQNQNQYRIICQKLNNDYRFATLYDIRNKIPLFSAYKYTGHQTGTRRPGWKTEPQLEDSKAGMSEGPANQAYNGDYVNDQNLNRGHLFPCSHAADRHTFMSTFTLTNAVPQYISFNGGSWSRMEQTVREIMNSQCRDEMNTGNILAYVLTGAVPNTETPPHTLNNRVNIPSHMWTAFCCYNSDSKNWMSQAHWAENKDESITARKQINPRTLAELQNFLKSQYNKDLTLFNGDCLDLLAVDVSQSPEADADDCDEPEHEEQSWWSYIKNVPAAIRAWYCGYGSVGME